MKPTLKIMTIVLLIIINSKQYHQRIYPKQEKYFFGYTQQEVLKEYGRQI
jgi:hypothetical protein